MMDYDFDSMTKILSEPLPTPKGEKEKIQVGKNMDANTQILLSIFEKVVCIEEKLEGKSQASQVSLPVSSVMLEGE